MIIQATLATWAESPEFGSRCAQLNIDPNNCQGDLLELYKQTRFDRLVRSRFLACKLQLDRVLLSVIQVRNLPLAEALYCRIKEENQFPTAIVSNPGTEASSLLRSQTNSGCFRLVLAIFSWGDIRSSPFYSASSEQP